MLSRCLVLAVALFCCGAAAAVAVDPATLPGDMLVGVRQADGGLALAYHTPAIERGDDVLFNTSRGAQPYARVMDAVELPERRSTLVYGAALDERGCRVLVREYGSGDAEPRTLYQTHASSADDGNICTAAAAAAEQYVRRQWMCALESANRLLLFDPFTAQLVLLRLGDGNVLHVPFDSIDALPLKRLAALHCSSDASLHHNNNHAYVALGNALYEVDVLALSSATTPQLHSTRRWRLERPRFLQLSGGGAASNTLFVLGGGSGITAELTALDVPSGEVRYSAALPPDASAGIGSMAVDEPGARLLLARPADDALLTLTLLRQRPALVRVSMRAAGILLPSLRSIAGAGGALVGAGEPSSQRPGVELARHCNTQPLHSHMVFSVTAYRGCDALPALGLADDAGVAFYVANVGGLERLDYVSTSGIDAAGLVFAHVIDGAARCAGGESALSLRALAHSVGSDELVVLTLAPRSGNASVVAPLQHEWREEARYAAPMTTPWSPATLTPGSQHADVCYATADAPTLVCSRRMLWPARVDWLTWDLSYACGGALLSLLWSESERALVVTCQPPAMPVHLDGRRTNATSAPPPPPLALVVDIDSNATIVYEPLPSDAAAASSHLGDDAHSYVVLAPGSRRYSLDADDGDAAAEATPRVLYAPHSQVVTQARDGHPLTWLEHRLPASLVGGAGVNASRYVVALPLNASWVAARHALDGHHERRVGHVASAVFVSVVAAFALLVCCAMVAVPLTTCRDRVAATRQRYFTQMGGLSDTSERVSRSHWLSAELAALETLRLAGYYALWCAPRHQFTWDTWCYTRECAAATRHDLNPDSVVLTFRKRWGREPTVVADDATAQAAQSGKTNGAVDSLLEESGSALPLAGVAARTPLSAKLATTHRTASNGDSDSDEDASDATLVNHANGRQSVDSWRAHIDRAASGVASALWGQVHRGGVFEEVSLSNDAPATSPPLTVPPRTAGSRVTFAAAAADGQHDKHA